MKILWGRHGQILRLCWRRYRSRCKYGLPCTALSHVCTPRLFLFTLAINKTVWKYDVLSLLYYRHLSVIIFLYCKLRKVLPEPHWLLGQRWSRILLPSARHQMKLQDHGHGASVLHGVPVYCPHYADTKLYSLGTVSVNDLPKVALALCVALKK